MPLIKLLYESTQSDRYILLGYDEYNDEMEDYDIDYYEAGDEAEEIAKYGGVSILRDKRLSSILFDNKANRIIGAVWVSDDNETFSFDVALDSGYQNMGLSKLLIEDAISEYEMQQEANEDLEMEVDVINPKLAKILEKKYGFHITAQIDQNRVLMSL